MEQRGGTDGGSRWGRGLRYALAAPPAVQGVRYLGKLALALFLLPADFGEASLAGLVAAAVGLLVIVGLDEALVAAPRLDAGTWRRLRGWHLASGAAGALLTAAIGAALLGVDGMPHLSLYLFALAPMVALANQSVLPTALLVRERRYRAILGVELAATCAATATALALAALGARGWSLVGGLHVNALVMVLGAARAARPLAAALPPPDEATARADSAHVARTGAHFGGAALLAFVGERVDALLVGFGLGRVALGLFELAQQLATAALGGAQSLSERVLLPTLASEHRERRLRGAALEALAIALAFAAPLHGFLALAGPDVVALLYAEEYSGAAALLPWLALAAGLRCLELPLTTGLKACGHGGAVLRLSALRLALAALAVALSLERGVVAVAAALLVARALATAASGLTLLAEIGRPSAGEAAGVVAALKGLLAWTALVLAGERWLLAPLEAEPAAHLAACASLALLAWLLARALFERERLASEWRLVRARATALVAGRRA